MLNQEGPQRMPPSSGGLDTASLHGLTASSVLAEVLEILNDTKSE